MHSAKVSDEPEALGKRPLGDMTVPSAVCSNSHTVLLYSLMIPN